jgi:hypothetical protein
MSRKHLLAAVLMLGAAACTRPATVTTATPGPAAAPPITDGGSLVAAMRRKYDGHWYRTLAFTQNNTLYGANGRETKSQWLERVALPGRLRIDYMPLASKSGLLYDGRRIHTIDNGRVVNSQQGINPQLLLQADAYVRAPDETARLLDSLGFKLATIRRDTWQGSPVWVVGAAAGDSTSNQFWVDASRLLVLRMVQREARGTRTVINETRFNRYTDVGGYPIAMEILLYRDGRMYFREELADVKVDPPLSDEAFDPRR